MADMKTRYSSALRCGTDSVSLSDYKDLSSIGTRPDEAPIRRSSSAVVRLSACTIIASSMLTELMTLIARGYHVGVKRSIESQKTGCCNLSIKL
jgi:hypothetical protein